MWIVFLACNVQAIGALDMKKQTRFCQNCLETKVSLNRLCDA
jgi:hypothetical protein